MSMGSILTIIASENTETSGNLKPKVIEGKIEFKNVSFAYPSKKEHLVLKNVSFIIEAGLKTALVGPSGCGKSTCIQLILRFYDVDEGEILLDNINIKDYDLRYLRSKLGLVSQQPFLFSDSIKNNILLGMLESEQIDNE